MLSYPVCGLRIFLINININDLNYANHRGLFDLNDDHFKWLFFKGALREILRGHCGVCLRWRWVMT